MNRMPAAFDLLTRDVARGVSLARIRGTDGQSFTALVHVLRLMFSSLTGWRRSAPAVLATLVPLLGWSQGIAPVGLQFSLTDSLPGDQVQPAIALGNSGGYLVWQDNAIDRLGSGIGARRLQFDPASGRIDPVGSAFRVNRSASADQTLPQVTLLPDGGAVVVWQGGKAALPEIFARVLNSNGIPVGTDIQVSAKSTTLRVSYSTNVMAYRHNHYLNTRFTIRETYSQVRNRSRDPAVATLADGSVVVLYSGRRIAQTNSQELTRVITTRNDKDTTNDVLRPVVSRFDAGREIFVQRLSAKGLKTGDEIQINQFSINEQNNPSIAPLSGGGYVVVWVTEHSIPDVSLRSPYRIDIVGRVFTAIGTPSSDEFIINSATNLSASPRVTALGEGFAVTWMERDADRQQGWDIWARAFDASGVAVSAAIRANEQAFGDQFDPQIVATIAGPKVIWTSLGQDGSQEGIYGRVLGELAGLPAGQENQINTTTVSKQIHPTLVTTGPYSLAVWSSYVGAGGFEILAQEFAGSGAGGFAPVPSLTTASGSVETIATMQPGPSLAFLGSSARTVSVVSESEPKPVLKLAPLPGTRSMALQWNAQPGRYYQVQSSADMRQWTPHGPLRRAEDIADSATVNVAEENLFYRVVLVR